MGGYAEKGRALMDGGHRRGCAREGVDSAKGKRAREVLAWRNGREYGGVRLKTTS